MTTLLTPRLRLRRWRDDDAPAYAEMCADPEVMRYIGDASTLTPDEAAAQIARFEAHWEGRGFGLWAVETLDGEELIGFAGLSVPAFLPEMLPAVELGWRFARRWWGRGFATETGQACLEHGFEVLGLRRIVGITTAGNAASQRVLGKLGIALDRDTVHPQLSVALRVYAIDADRRSAGGMRVRR